MRTTRRPVKSLAFGQSIGFVKVFDPQCWTSGTERVHTKYQSRRHTTLFRIWRYGSQEGQLRDLVARLTKRWQ